MFFANIHTNVKFLKIIFSCSQVDSFFKNNKSRVTGPYMCGWMRKEKKCWVGQDEKRMSHVRGREE